MENPMWMASIFGPFLIIVSLWILFYRENTIKFMSSCKNTPGVFCLWGIMNLLIGLTVLSIYNLWVWDLSLLVTLFGWLQLIRGLLVLFLPQAVIKMSTHKTWMSVGGVISLIWGICLSWLAFWS